MISFEFEVPGDGGDNRKDGHFVRFDLGRAFLKIGLIIGIGEKSVLSVVHIVYREHPFGTEVFLACGVRDIRQRNIHPVIGFKALTIARSIFGL